MRVDATLAVEFREAMANLCAPVTVVGVLDDERAHGTTVSAVMSLSMTPPLIAVALADTSDTLALIRRTGAFSINVLSAAQASIAMSLATKGVDKFADIGWHRCAGTPRVADCAAWLPCTVADDLPGGDHRIIVGAVADASIDPGASPLTYHRRTFGTHVAH
ncbi:flavin reductase family protein [Gordonia humi]